MGKYDYCSAKEFVELVRKCYLGNVDLVYKAEGEDFNREDALGIIKGMTTMAQSLIYAIEKDNKE